MNQVQGCCTFFLQSLHFSCMWTLSFYHLLYFKYWFLLLILGSLSWINSHSMDNFLLWYISLPPLFHSLTLRILIFKWSPNCVFFDVIFLPPLHTLTPLIQLFILYALVVNDWIDNCVNCVSAILFFFLMFLQGHFRRRIVLNGVYGLWCGLNEYQFKWRDWITCCQATASPRSNITVIKDSYFFLFFPLWHSLADIIFQKL